MDEWDLDDEDIENMSGVEWTFFGVSIIVLWKA